MSNIPNKPTPLPKFHDAQYSYFAQSAGHNGTFQSLSKPKVERSVNEELRNYGDNETCTSDDHSTLLSSDEDLREIKVELEEILEMSSSVRDFPMRDNSGKITYSINSSLHVRALYRQSLKDRNIFHSLCLCILYFNGRCYSCYFACLHFFYLHVDSFTSVSTVISIFSNSFLHIFHSSPFVIVVLSSQVIGFERS